MLKSLAIEARRNLIISIAALWLKVASTAIAQLLEVFIPNIRLKSEWFTSELAIS